MGDNIAALLEKLPQEEKNKLAALLLQSEPVATSTKVRARYARTRVSLPGEVLQVLADNPPFRTQDALRKHMHCCAAQLSHALNQFTTEGLVTRGPNGLRLTEEGRLRLNRPTPENVPVPVVPEEPDTLDTDLKIQAYRVDESNDRKAKRKKLRIKELRPRYLRSIAAGEYKEQWEVGKLHKSSGPTTGDVFAALMKAGEVYKKRGHTYCLTPKGYEAIGMTPPQAKASPEPVARVVNPGTQLDITTMVEKFVQGEAETPPKPTTQAHAKQMLLDIDAHHVEQLQKRIKGLEAEIRGHQLSQEGLKKKLAEARTATNAPPEWEEVVASHKAITLELQRQNGGLKASSNLLRVKIAALELRVAEGVKLSDDYMNLNRTLTQRNEDYDRLLNEHEALLKKTQAEKTA